ncbi:hypothetical protein [Ruegeria sp. EL01]|uniref:hypothetical protein n=1 Tax=Ruegeria sp. EL01 TaxID=2107578 RepID=UPI000EA817B8|nr:hypothetical protein [Ruegeria sp. EL01]
MAPIFVGFIGWFLTFAYAALHRKLRLAYAASILWFVLLGLALYWRSIETYDITRAAIAYIIWIHLWYGVVAIIGWSIGAWWRKRSRS